MNEGRKVSRENEPSVIGAEERVEIDTFIQRLKTDKDPETLYVLTGRSRVFANTLVEALDQNKYILEYHFGNKGGTRGQIELSDGFVVGLIDKLDYDYQEKEIRFRKRIAGQNHNPIFSEIRMLS